MMIPRLRYYPPIFFNYDVDEADAADRWTGLGFRYGRYCLLLDPDMAWRSRWWRLTTWLDRRVSALRVRLGLRNPTACRVCGRDDMPSYDETGAMTYCPDHCPDHDYSREFGWPQCNVCGVSAPDDYYCD